MNTHSLVTTTESVDRAFYFIFGVSAVALLGIVVAIIWLVWRYNRKRQPQPLSQKDHNVWLEVTWTIIPTILVMMMFWYGWEGYLSLRRVPDNAMSVTATARMWSWLFTYENGKTADKLYVPVGQPVKVKLIAEDVLHSFYAPAFRVKRDCVPGMETYVWFVADKPGSFDIFCAEYCGVAHADMITTIEAVPAAEFAGWLAEKPDAVAAGRSLLQKHGCLGCHSLDGSPMVGPSFQGIGGRETKIATAGGEQRTLVADAAYLERAILDPAAEIVVGFPPAMPSYAGRIPEEELKGIIETLMGLATGDETSVPAAPDEPATPPTSEAPMTATEPPAKALPAAGAAPEAKSAAATPPAAADAVARGEALAGQSGCLGCHSLDGSRRLGPSFKGLFGAERTVVKGGQEMTIKADAAYLERAIREPGAEIAKDYPPAMPPYPNLSPADIEALLAWLEAQK